jgi:peptide/nickel transport system permease protein
MVKNRIKSGLKLKKVFAFSILGLWIFAALFADLLASNAPLYARIGDKTIYPAFYLAFHRDYVFHDSAAEGKTISIQYSTADWRQFTFQQVIWPPVPYSAQFMDPFNRGFTSPFSGQHFVGPAGRAEPLPRRFRHWLGADDLGRDVFAGLIHASRVALLIGVLSMAIAAIIGIILGAAAGYSGGGEQTIPLGRVVWMCIGVLLAWFYGVYVHRFDLLDAAAGSFSAFIFQVVICLFIIALILYLFGKTAHLAGRIIRRPVAPFFAGLIMRLVEFTDSLPAILLLLTISALFHNKGMGLMILLIGLINWTLIARLTRAETLRIKQLDYIESARALGYSTVRIIFRHILPNAMAPVYVAISFGVAGAILLESSLSFLGLGLPPQTVSWGSMLGEARGAITAWWMIIFPGMALMFSLLALNMLGEILREK